MRDFIREIKKIECEKLIFSFSKLSIEMFRQKKCTLPVDVAFQYHGMSRRFTTIVSAWDLLGIEYLAVLHSNDFHHAQKVVPIEQLINLYHKYENDHSIAPALKTTNTDTIFRALMGMTAEQFQFQDLRWVFEKFNRDYYILHAAKFEHRVSINVDDITKKVFGLSVEDYISILILILGLCIKSPTPLSAYEENESLIQRAIYSKPNIEKVIQHYSCTYKELRANSLGKQLLYSKPFVFTQRSRSYIASSLFLVTMAVGNGLYWLARDYYFEQKTQEFTNEFGLLFEDYIKELCDLYCKKVNGEFYLQD